MALPTDIMKTIYGDEIKKQLTSIMEPVPAPVGANAQLIEDRRRKQREKRRAAHQERMARWTKVADQAIGFGMAKALLWLHKPDADGGCLGCFQETKHLDAEIPWPCKSFQIVEEYLK